MNPRLLLLAPFSFFILPLLFAQDGAPQAAVPVTRPAPDTTLYTPPAGEDQRLYGDRQSSLIAPEAARAIAEKFRAAYGQAASPRIVVYVNQNPAAADSSLRLAGRTEKVYETTNAEKGAGPKTTTASSESTYTAGDVSAAVPTIADQQTVREVERLFGRVFRSAGARLADAKVAMAMLAATPEVVLHSQAAAKEREALKQVADIAIEVLISSHNLTITRLSGDYTYEVPDLQVTAIRLGDAAIIGQAAASDVLGHGERSVRIARQFAIGDITEATAFALMEDMLTNAK